MENRFFVMPIGRPMGIADELSDARPGTVPDVLSDGRADRAAERVNDIATPGCLNLVGIG